MAKKRSGKWLETKQRKVVRLDGKWKGHLVVSKVTKTSQQHCAGRKKRKKPF